MKQLKSFVAGMMVMTFLCFAVTVNAGLKEKLIKVYTGTSVFVNDLLFEPRDENGSPVDIFTINGRTYVPVEDLMSALGHNMTWVQDTTSLYIYTSQHAVGYQEPERPPQLPVTTSSGTLTNNPNGYRTGWSADGQPQPPLGYGISPVPSSAPAPVATPTPTPVYTPTPTAAPTPTPVPTPAPVRTTHIGEGTIGEYYVRIVSATRVVDWANRPSVLVTYEWTNNSTITTSFFTALTTQLFQEGVGCNITTSIDSSYNTDSITTSIRPGTTISINVLYLLHNAYSPVEVEVSEQWGAYNMTPIVYKQLGIN